MSRKVTAPQQVERRRVNWIQKMVLSSKRDQCAAAIHEEGKHDKIHLDPTVRDKEGEMGGKEGWQMYQAAGHTPCLPQT